MSKKTAEEVAAEEAAKAAEKAAEAAREAEEANLVNMFKNGETLKVHPTCVNSHIAKGWQIAGR